jgi:hypothetical protein
MRGGVGSAAEPVTRRLDADQPRPRAVLEVGEGGEGADRVGAAADAGDDGVGAVAAGGHEELGTELAAHHRLEVADDHRVGVGADDRADDVEGIAHVVEPVAERHVDGVLERARARGHGAHLGAEQAHAEDVERLAPHVLLAHVDDALESVAGGGGGGGDAVLARAGLGDHTALAHPPRQQRLTDGVVDLVRAGVVEVLALEEDAGAAEPAGQVLGEGERAGAAHVLAQVAIEGVEEAAVGSATGVGLGQLVERGDERFGDVAAAIGAEPSSGVGSAEHGHLLGAGRGMLRPARRWRAGSLPRV